MCSEQSWTASLFLSSKSILAAFDYVCVVSSMCHGHVPADHLIFWANCPSRIT